jgi:phosphohistidine phosphatase
MRLLLVRHAKAEERDPALWPDDALRPLTDAGRSEFARFAKRLRAAGIVADAVLASPAARAWATAELLHRHAKWPLPIRCPALGPDDDAVLLRFRDVLPSDARGTIALVGHDPAFSHTASWLLTADAARLSVDFKKGACLSLELPDEARDAPGGRATLEWLWTPRVARKKRS